MNVYDFDGTIFHPNSAVQFARFCVRRHPTLFFKFELPTIGEAIKYGLKITSKRKLFSKFHTIVKYLSDPDEEVRLYWKKYEKNISSWYLKQKRSDDIIISGSPTYLLKPLTDKLGVNCVGTEVDKETGVLISNINMAREKAKYFIDRDMPVIDNFYSDSLSDTPLALLSERAFLVSHKASKVEPWPSIANITKKIFKKLKYD